MNSTHQELDEITRKDKRNNGLIFDIASELRPRAPPATPTSTQGRPSTTEPPAAIASATSEASSVPPERHKEPSHAGLLLQQKSAVAWPLAGEGGWPEAALHGGHRGPHSGESDQRRRHTRRRPHARQPTRARWYALRGPAATYWASGPRPRRPGKADGRSTTGARGRTRSVARKEKGERRWCAPAALNAGSTRHRRAAAPPQGQTAAAPGVGVGFQP